MTILDTIADHARRRVADAKARVSLEETASQARALADEELERDGSFRYPFRRALQVPDLSFICEVKKASPSKGVIAEDFPYAQIAREYDYAGAAAISCLTEPKWFLGRDEYLSEIVQEVSIPVLRKDFVVDEYMIYQAKTLGASAVLLICAILDDDQLAHYGALARDLGMSALVEAHDAEEIARALASGASIIGVNNRDLNDFSVDFENARTLRELVPPDVLYVAESGVKDTDDVAAIARMGADAVLIGEALMRVEDKITLFSEFYDAAVQAAQGVSNIHGGAVNGAGDGAVNGAAVQTEPSSAELPSKVFPAIKICGVCQPDDVAILNDVLPDYVGFVFCDRSKRFVTADEARTLRAALDARIATVGVFVDAPVEEIATLFNAGTISVAQLHGEEDEAYIQELRDRCPDLVIWKAFEITDGTDVARAQQSSADLVLLDAGKGSGMSFDHALLAGITRPFALAGGLDPQNVVEVLDQCEAAGVVPVILDVSSGVEADGRADDGRDADGRTKKDPAKIDAFVKAIRNF